MSHHPRRALGYDTGWRLSRAVRPDRGTLVVALPAEAQQSSLGYHGIVRLYGRAQLPRQIQAYSWWSFYVSSCSRFSSHLLATSSSPVPRRYKAHRSQRDAILPFVHRILRGPATFTRRSEEKATDCEGRKTGKKAAYEIAAPISSASQVLAQIRVPPETEQLWQNSSDALCGTSAGNYLPMVYVHGWAKRRFRRKSWNTHFDLLSDCS
jgi:hypothetical protein